MREPVRSSPNTRAPLMSQELTPTPSAYHPDRPGTPEEAPTQLPEGDETTPAEEGPIQGREVHHRTPYPC